MRTMIAVPCMDQVPALFTNSLASLQKVDECTLAMQIGSLIYDSRNQLAAKAIQMNYDYVFWLDSDMVFPTDTLVYMHKVMAENNLDILSGLYFRRRPPYSPVLFDKFEIDDSGCHWTEFEDIPDSLFEIGACGFGCVLMKTSVLVGTYLDHNGQLFQPIMGVGEDCAFCWRARESGYKIWCDPKATLGHVGHMTVTKEMHDILKNGD